MRTEEQKIASEPVKVFFGGKEFEIKPLPLKFATPWRKKFIALTRELSVLSSITSDDSNAFLNALVNILSEKPDALVDLFFEYVPYLKREEIENISSSIEMLHAIEEVVAFEAPFLGTAIRITRTMQKNLV